MTEAAIPSFEALVPMLPVTDVTRAIDFYRQLGFEVGGTHTPEGLSAPVWAWLRRGGTHMMINRAEAPITATHASASVWVYTKDVQSAHAALRSRGLDVVENRAISKRLFPRVMEELRSRGLDVGTIDHPPYNPRGEFHVHDPDGYAIFIAHAD